MAFTSSPAQKVKSNRQLSNYHSHASSAKYEISTLPGRLPTFWKKRLKDKLPALFGIFVQHGVIRYPFLIRPSFDSLTFSASSRPLPQSRQAALSISLILLGSLFSQSYQSSWFSPFLPRAARAYEPKGRISSCPSSPFSMNRYMRRRVSPS